MSIAEMVRCEGCGTLVLRDYLAQRGGMALDPPLCRDCGRLQPVRDLLESIDARLAEVVGALKDAAQAATSAGEKAG
jgi:hypothetical protein